MTITIVNNTFMSDNEELNCSRNNLNDKNNVELNIYKELIMSLQDRINDFKHQVIFLRRLGTKIDYNKKLNIYHKAQFGQ